MKMIGNFGAIMSAFCLFAALMSAQHDYRNRIMHNTDSVSLPQISTAVGSFGVEYATLSMK